MLKRFILRIKLNKAIKQITDLLYSDSLKLNTEEDCNFFTETISRKQKSDNFLFVYIVIQYVIKNISHRKIFSKHRKESIDEILDKIQDYDKLYDRKLIASTIKVERLQANIYLRRAGTYFDLGRKAFELNINSFEAKKYIYEKNNKKPYLDEGINFDKTSVQTIEDLEIELEQKRDELKRHIENL